MPVYDKPTRNYYSISEDASGKPGIRHKDRNGNETYYGGIEGILTKIDLVADEFEGETFFKYHFYFEDADHSQTDILQVGEKASAARGILLTLISCNEPVGWVKVSPYHKKHEDKTYTNVWVEVDGQTVDWDEKIHKGVPDIEVVQVGDQKIKNDQARRQYFRKIAKRLTTDVLTGHGSPPADSQNRNGSGAPAEAKPANDKTEAVYGRAQSEPKVPTGKPDSQMDGVNMDNWEDMDDDLPF